MSMVTNKTFTLGELAKIALGATELTNDHLSVLRSLVVILLQKLDCQNERVRITGFSAKCIQDLLKDNAEVDDFDFQMETVKEFKEKYKLLDDMESKVKEIDLKMEEHNQQIRNYYHSGRNIYAHSMWDGYTSAAEDLCSISSLTIGSQCAMVCNFIFNVELRCRALPPIYKRFDEIDKKINAMQDKLKKLEKMAVGIAPKLIAIEYILKDIEYIRHFVLKGYKDFHDAMSETDEMINCKLHRLTLPGLKRYLDRRFSHFKTRLRVLKDISEIPSFSKAVVLKNNKTCLSCYRQKELNNFIDAEKLPIQGLLLCYDSLREPSLLEKIDRIERSVFK